MDIPEISQDKNTAKIIEFIDKYIEKSGTEGGVIGLSGGIDSTVVAYLTGQLSKKRFIGLSMPVKESNEHAKIVAEEKNLVFKEIKLKNLLKSYLDSIPDGEIDSVAKIVKGNLLARIRMSILYYYSNKENLLVIGTGNKSERYLGYYTKYGDGAADIQPIGGLYKTQVRQLARYLEVPREIIDKKPSAGLWEGQTDEKEIGIKYRDIDPIIYNLEKDIEPEKIANKLSIDPKKVLKINKMHERTKHKRETSPVCKIDENKIEQ